MSARSSAGAASPLQQRVFGTPGAALIGAGRALPAKRAHQGKLGEERLAGLTRQVVDATPGMFLFHSVKLPSETGDVDQLLYAGGQFFLMDAKLWKGFDGQSRMTYDVAMRDSETMVFVRNGQPFSGGDVKAPKQLAKWKKYLSGHRVQAVIVLMDPGAQVAGAAWKGDVLVINALELQSWLRSLPPTGQRPLHEVWIRELAGLTFDPAAKPVPRKPRSGKGASSRPRPGASAGTAPWQRPIASATRPSSQRFAPPPASRPASSPRLPTVTAPLPLRRETDALETALGTLVTRAVTRAQRLGRWSLRSALWAWVAWLASLAAYLVVHEQTALWAALCIASFGLSIAATWLGVTGNHEATDARASRIPASWGLGLAVAHLTLAFVVPLAAIVALVVAPRL
ncbi:hypothetical protein [Agrococcus sp. TF02-05]|uniref:hypothetical protein n=1 Tax=Agrococcus sp. TF02-05 TaxID=2815211 RepID=UPI001AA15375|nr:hypothetical protein [Agrococcus sp. TF02-05]MBO1769513.1 hypothetical protein [Agrococcus sp. TF02-05]